MKLSDLYTNQTLAKYIADNNNISLERGEMKAELLRNDFILWFDNLDQNEVFQLFNEKNQDWQDKMVKSYGFYLSFDELVNIAIANVNIVVNHDYKIYDKNDELIIGRRLTHSIETRSGNIEVFENYKV